jgi:hypothetical protein
MESRERDIPVRSGHSFQNVNVYGKAHLGDAHYHGKLAPDFANRTLTVIEIILSIIYHTLLRRLSIHSTGNMSLHASRTPESTFFKRYTTGLTEKTTEISSG